MKEEEEREEDWRVPVIVADLLIDSDELLYSRQEVSRSRMVSAAVSKRRGRGIDSHCSQGLFFFLSTSAEDDTSAM